MKRPGFNNTPRLVSGLSTIALLFGASPQTHGADQKATGVVFADINKNGNRDEGEPGLPHIRVSNQKEIVFMDEDGRWELPASDDAIFFVIKPSGWTSPLNDNLLPQFYYIHKPAGSPESKYPGVKPTGALPRSIDFLLRILDHFLPLRDPTCSTREGENGCEHACRKTKRL